MFDMVAKAVGWGGQLVIAGDESAQDGRHLIQNWIADTSKFRHDFDYVERVSMREAFRISVEDELAGE